MTMTLSRYTGGGIKEAGCSTAENSVSASGALCGRCALHLGGTGVLLILVCSKGFDLSQDIRSDTEVGKL